MKIHILLFDRFETLDAFGPAEVFGKVPDCELSYDSVGGGPVKSAQGIEVVTRPADPSETGEVWLIPGGMGTRTLVDDEKFLRTLRGLADGSRFCLSVCTGSALLAKCGALDGERATSNKRSLEWAKNTSDQVRWIERARWVVSGKFYTSSGISAGMDMALGFVSDQWSRELALEIADRIEYIWNEDRDRDDFAKK